MDPSEIQDHDGKVVYSVASTYERVSLLRLQSHCIQAYNPKIFSPHSNSLCRKDLYSDKQFLLLHINRPQLI
jgi:hypothetical protein